MITTATDFGAALAAAFQGQYVAQLTGQTYTITSPIVIHVTGTVTGPLGIDGGGATIVSQVTNGAPVIQIVVDPDVDMRYLTLSNFTIQGNGQEGDGIQIVADGNDRWRLQLERQQRERRITSAATASTCRAAYSRAWSRTRWMNGNAKGGAYFRTSRRWPGQRPAAGSAAASGTTAAPA